MRGDRRAKGAKAKPRNRASAKRRHEWEQWQHIPEGFTDRQGHALEEGKEVKFHSTSGNVLQAVVEEDHNMGRMVSIRVGQDPFPTYVDHRQLEVKRVPTSTPSAKELRRKARNLRIDGWEEMDRRELATAVKAAEADDETEDDESEDDDESEASEDTTEDDEDDPDEDDPDDEDEKEEAVPAKRTASKKRGVSKRRASSAPSKRAPRSTKKSASKRPAKAAKATTKKAPRPPVEYEGPNPFRAGSNNWHITQALLKGGKASTLAKSLLTKLNYNPRKQKPKDFDAQAETEYRLMRIGYILRDDHGFDYQREGRGSDAFIKVVPPSNGKAKSKRK